MQNVGKPEETRKNKELQNQPSGERLLELLDRGKIKGWYMKGSFSVAREKLYALWIGEKNTLKTYFILYIRKTS